MVGCLVNIDRQGLDVCFRQLSSGKFIEIIYDMFFCAVVDITEKSVRLIFEVNEANIANIESAREHSRAAKTRQKTDYQNQFC